MLDQRASGRSGEVGWPVPAQARGRLAAVGLAGVWLVGLWLLSDCSRGWVLLARYSAG